MLRRQSEGVGDTIEKCEERGDVDGLGDFLLVPANVVELTGCRPGILCRTRSSLYATKLSSWRSLALMDGTSRFPFDRRG